MVSAWTEANYQAALETIEHLWDAEPGTADGDKLEMLVSLVELYEDEHYPMKPPTPWQLFIYRLQSWRARCWFRAVLDLLRELLWTVLGPPMAEEDVGL